MVFDVDGVLTDGGLWINSSGDLSKRFDVRDGLGISLLLQYGIEVAFLSGGQSGATEARAKQLGVKNCFVLVKDKRQVIVDLQRSLGISSAETIFLGDDLNDLVIKPYVSLLIATKDSCLALRKRSHLILNKKGGDGAVREIAERVLRVKGNLLELEKKGWLNNND